MSLAMDPTTMSVRTLRSVLSEYGVAVPSGTVKKEALVELFLEEGVAAKAMERERSDNVLKKKKRKSSTIPWADVDVVPKKSQRSSWDQEEVREREGERKERETRRKAEKEKKETLYVRVPSSAQKKQRSNSRGRKASSSTAFTYRAIEEDEWPLAGEKTYRLVSKLVKGSMKNVYEPVKREREREDVEMEEAMEPTQFSHSFPSHSLTPSPPPLRSRRGSRAVREREREEEKRERERERIKKERLAQQQREELEALKRLQETERKRFQRRQSQELAEITAKREALERQRQQLQAAMSERNVSLHSSLAVPNAKAVKRRATASPRAKKRDSLLPRLTPENTRRRVEERHSLSPITLPSPTSATSRDDSLWESAPVSPPDHTVAYSEEENDCEEDVYREEDEEGLSLEVLVLAVLAILLLSVAVFAFVHYRPLTLPYCAPSQSGDCVACPRHGTCEGMDLSCNSGHIKQWASGKWHCVEDIETKRIAHSVLTNEFERMLRQRKGERDCNQLARPVMLEHEAKIELERMYQARVGITKAASSFDDFYREIERLVILDPELTVSKESGSAGYYFTSSSTPLRPIGCEIKLFFVERALYIGIGLIIVSIVAFKVWQVKRISETTDIVLQALKKSRAEENSGLPIVHLRDTVAPPSLLKGFIWKGVYARIEADSRVGRTLQLLNGEHQDMWEWEAPL